MSDDTYMKLLDKALSQLPPKVTEKDRFELPNVVCSISGNRTILYNLNEISNQLRRSKEHLLKYLSGELATAGTIDGNHAIFQGKFYRRAIENILDRYAKAFVFCPTCNKPDTKIIKNNRLFFLVCEACGAKSSIIGM